MSRPLTRASRLVVDLGAIADLRKIEQTGGALVIGAMATHAEVAESKTVTSALPGLTVVERASAPPNRSKF